MLRLSPHVDGAEHLRKHAAFVLAGHELDGPWDASYNRSQRESRHSNFAEDSLLTTSGRPRRSEATQTDWATWRRKPILTSHLQTEGGFHERDY